MQVRQGLKEYSDWPTYPQLYAGGELLGGCDIILEMHEKGELLSALQEAVQEVRGNVFHIHDGPDVRIELQFSLIEALSWLSRP